MNRALLDQGLAPAAASILRKRGWHAIHVSQVGLGTAPDPAVMDYARENQLACVTLDHDFHLHLAQAAARGPSVVLLRVEGLTAPQQAELILWIWETCNAEIASGAAVSADRFTIRLRKLPLRIDPKPSG